MRACWVAHGVRSQRDSVSRRTASGLASPARAATLPRVIARAPAVDPCYIYEPGFINDGARREILDWLVQWGIAPGRLDARGFGSAKPLVSPDQRGAAKINDRIEFIILERK